MLLLFEKPITLELWREFAGLTSGGRLRQGEAYVTKNQREEVMKTRNKTSTNRLKVDLHSNEDSQLNTNSNDPAAKSKITKSEVVQHFASSPDRDEAVAEEGHSDVYVHPQGPHQPPDRPHDAEDGHIPCVVKHARAVGGHTVCVEPKVSAAEVSREIACLSLARDLSRPDELSSNESL